MCTVCTLIAKNYSRRMFTKSEFTPAHQITAHWLEKTKKIGKTVQYVRSAVQNVHCAHPNCQKIWYKNVYEILIQTCTPKISCLPWKQKSWQNSAKFALCSAKCQLIKSCGTPLKTNLKFSLHFKKKSRACLFPNFLSGLTLVRCYRDANKMLVWCSWDAKKDVKGWYISSNWF